jgi:2-succinyl-6-hydroxy-2,4-cyclohexadiene-1-carboxylate synthase
VSTVERRHLAVNGLQISALLQDTVQDCQQTLVLLHGFTGSAANWIDLFPALQAPGRRLIALDLPGHGHSAAPADPGRYAIEQSCDDLCAALRALGVGACEAVLLGYSLGGRIALAAACSGFLRALILESASPGIADPAERELRRQSDALLAERIESAGVAAFVHEWEQLPLFASQRTLPEATRVALRTQRLRNRAQGLAQSLRGAGAGVQTALHARLPALDLPVLLLAGERDNKYCRIACEMAALLPQAQLTLVPAAGHAIHLEQPADFCRLVNAFCCTVF